MKVFLTLVATLALVSLAPAQVVVDAAGTDTFSTADMHGIANNGSAGVASVTIDLSATAGAFWDMDGASTFGNGTEPIIGAGNYAGTVTWSPTGGQDPTLTATFSPALANGEFVRFGADTDFFVSDPCPGGNFATGGAVVTVVDSAGNTTTCTYAFIDTNTSEATCGSAGFTLATSDSCPGTMTFTVTGETPGGDIAFIYGVPGSFTQGGTPCTGTMVGIANPTIAQFGPATSASGTVPAGACGTIRVQAVDVATCTVSNFIDL